MNAVAAESLGLKGRDLLSVADLSAAEVLAVFDRAAALKAEFRTSRRDQGADADRAVERMVDRLLHRQGRRTATARDADPERPGGGT